MSTPSPDEIAHAVLRWQRRHPLAQRLGSQAVHSIGLVALPFLRHGTDNPATPFQSPWRQSLNRLLRRAGSSGVPVFTEKFIDGISPARAADFAQRYGVASVEGAEGWPQRRVNVDPAQAESPQGGWPFELWLASAAVEGAQGRHRVLVGLTASSRHPAVLGRRHWDPRRLMAAAAVSLAAAVALGWSLRGAPSAPPDVRVVGAVLGASAPSSGAVSPNGSGPAVLHGTTAPASAASVPDAATAAASTADIVASAAAASAALLVPDVPLPASGPPPFDIRPRLGVIRERSAPRPPLGGGLPRPAELASTPPPAPAPQPPAPATAETPPSSAEPTRPYAGASDPERVRARVASTGERTLALVSSPYKTKADAESMLARMREHVTTALKATDALNGEVFESPQGYRAALYPFGSREEAQIVNATMVARGWRTRAMEF